MAFFTEMLPKSEDGPCNTCCEESCKQSESHCPSLSSTEYARLLKVSEIYIPSPLFKNKP